tara:strand:+ start:671 stop:865 length:195 start_codon:yes stop_codon:yes gene_type:complete
MKTSKEFINDTIELVKSMDDGLERMDFIEGIHESVEHAIYMRYPLKQVREYRDLLTKLIKNFGH